MMGAGPIAQARADLAASLAQLTPLPVVSNVPERDWGPVSVEAYTSVTSADSQAYLAAQITTRTTYTIEKD